MTKQEPQDPQKPQVPQDAPVANTRRGTLLALVFVVLLVCGGLLLAHTLRSMAQVQDCAISGRSNCGAVDTTASGN